MAELRGAGDASPLCPRCAQDRIGRYRIRATGEEVWLCPECDALWVSSDLSTVFSDFTAYMAERGRPGLWCEVEVL